MRRNLVFSLVMLMLIFTYSFYLQILPLQGRIQVAEQLNQRLQIQWQEQHIAVLKPSLNSTEFYAWLNAQHLSGLQLLSLLPTERGLHLVLLANPQMLNTFLTLAGDSEFLQLRLIDLNSNQIKIDAVFRSLNLDTQALVVAEENKVEESPSAVVGVVHQHEQQFCVMQTTQGIRLVRNNKC